MGTSCANPTWAQLHCETQNKVLHQATVEVNST